MNPKFIASSLGAAALAMAGAAPAQDWQPSSTASEAVDTELWYYCVYITLDNTEYLTQVFPAKTSERGAISDAWKAYVNQSLPVDAMPHIACSSNADRALAEHYRSGRANRKIPVGWPGEQTPRPSELPDLDGFAEPAQAPVTAPAEEAPVALPPPVTAAAETPESVEENVAAVLASRDDEWQRMKAASDAQIAARNAAEIKYQQDVAAAKAAREQYEKDKAANDAAVERARLEREQYERELAAHEAKYGKAAN